MSINYYIAFFGFIIGLVSEVFFGNLFLLISAPVLFGVCSLFFIHKKLNSQRDFLKKIILFLSFFIFGSLRIIWFQAGFINDIDEFKDREVLVSGFVLDEVFLKKDQSVFVLNSKMLSSGEEKRKTSAKIIIRTRSLEDINYGDGILVSGRLKTIEDAYEDLPSYRNYLLKDKVVYEIKNAEIEKTDVFGGFYIKSQLFYLKNWFLNNLKSNLGEPDASLSGGMTVAGRGALEKDLQDIFTRAGIIHIVVLSGYNIAIIIGVLLALFKKVGRKTRTYLSIIMVSAFVVMSGAGAPIVRSALMALIALLGKLNYKKTDSLRLLLVVAIIMILWNPYILFFDLSFQLTILATFAILEIAPILEKRFSFFSEKFGIREIASQTFGVQIFLAPFILYKIGTFSLAGFFVNLLVLPIVPFIMLFSFIIGFFGFLGSALFPFALIIKTLVSYMIFISKLFTSFSFAVFSTESFSVFITIFLYVLIFYFYFKFKEKSKEI